jgi:predicted acetyltransferase
MEGFRIDGLEIRAPREEEFHEIVALANIAFGEEATEQDESAFRRAFPFDRALCAFDAGRLVSSLAVLSLELTLPGRTALRAGGATWGATLPTHRRRGILRALFGAQLNDMRDRGDPLSVLLASEAPLYGRYGYGPASSIMSFKIDRAYARFATESGGDAPEGITLVTGVEAAGRLAGIYESFRLHQPGAVSRSPGWWASYLWDPLFERQGGTAMYHAVHASRDGAADGYVTYRLKEQWAGYTPMGEVQVLEVIARDPAVYRALWEFVLGTDLCQTVSCWKGRVDEPLRWLLADSRRLAVDEVADDLYVRLLDIPRALAAREYAASGELVLEVSEPFPVACTGRFLLESGGIGAGAECRPTDRDPDLSLGVEALGAAYLGGVSFTTLAAAGRVSSADRKTLAAADAMFSSGIAPYCSTMF